MLHRFFYVEDFTTQEVGSPGNFGRDLVWQYHQHYLPRRGRSRIVLGSLEEQSASLPGSPPPVNMFLRCTSSRALRAASRARAAMNYFLNDFLGI